MAVETYIVISWTLLYLSLGLQFIQGSTAMEEFVPGQLDSIPYLSAVVRNSYQCQRLCVVSEPCQGVDFNVQDRLCNLYSSKLLDSEGQKSEFHVIHLVKDNIEKGGVCGQEPCGEGEMCVTTGQGYLCLAAVQCDTPEQLPSLIKEQVVFNTYSDTTIYSCGLGYIQTDNRSCQIVDTWSSPLLDLNCAPIPNLVATGMLLHGPAQLTCTTKNVTSGSFLIGCDDDELPVDCSVMSEQYEEVEENGVKIVEVDGKAHCQFPQGTTGSSVRSVRCCKMEKMECEYLHGDASGAHIDDVSNVTCYKESFPLGCSLYADNATGDGDNMGQSWSSDHRAGKGSATVPLAVHSMEVNNNLPAHMLATGSWHYTPAFRTENYPSDLDVCNDSLTIHITDSSFTASSQWRDTHRADRARLYTQKELSMEGAWSAGTNDENQWLQVHLLGLAHVQTVTTQGRNAGYKQWVTKYTVEYSLYGTTWIPVTEETGGVQVFDGNTDTDTPVTNSLGDQVIARYVRVRPREWHEHVSMRMDVNGCYIGVSAYAACCSAPGLSCHVEVVKQKPVNGEVTATCPTDHQMTGCIGMEIHPALKGSYITDDVSTGVSTCHLATRNDNYTFVYMTCCKK